MSTTIILNRVRMSHPHLWVPQPPMAGSQSGPKFDGTFLFPVGSENDTLAQGAFIKEAQATFGPNFATIVGALDKGKKCLRNGDQKLTKEGVVAEGYAGQRFIVAKNKVRPMVIAKRFHEGKPVQLNDQGATFQNGVSIAVPFECKVPYAGCYVNAKVEIYAMNKPGLQGIYANLIAVQFEDDGESFGGGGTPNAEGFEEGEDDGGGFGGGATTTAPAAANLFG